MGFGISDKGLNRIAGIVDQPISSKKAGVKKWELLDKILEFMPADTLVEELNKAMPDEVAEEYLEYLIQLWDDMEYE